MKPDEIKNYFNVSWEEVEKAIDYISAHLRYSEFDGIYGVPRGGLIPAYLLSRRLNLPLKSKPTKRTLVVDDISDTGKTLKGIKNKNIVTIYSSKWTKTEPDMWFYMKGDKTSWIVFPWEKRDGY